jgi:hypothetical protein
VQVTFARLGSVGVAGFLLVLKAEIWPVTERQRV